MSPPFSSLIVHLAPVSICIYAKPSRHGLIGDPQPHEQHTSFGPLISKGQYDKVLNYVKSGKDEKASVIVCKHVNLRDVRMRVLMGRVRLVEVQQKSGMGRVGMLSLRYLVM
jgi:hypothetical protein